MNYKRGNLFFFVFSYVTLVGLRLEGADQTICDDSPGGRRGLWLFSLLTLIY